jgi:hypothetical protein
MKNKYFNTKTKGSDSKIEIKRMNELLLLEKAGVIKDITKQPSFILQEGFKYKNDKRAEISIKYTADFRYWDNEKQRWVIEELKSSYTKKLADYSIRRRLFKYSIKDKQDIEFIEIIYDK